MVARQVVPYRQREKAKAEVRVPPVAARVWRKSLLRLKGRCSMHDLAA